MEPKTSTRMTPSPRKSSKANLKSKWHPLCSRCSMVYTLKKRILTLWLVSTQKDMLHKFQQRRNNWNLKIIIAIWGRLWKIGGSLGDLLLLKGSRRMRILSKRTFLPPLALTQRRWLSRKKRFIPRSLRRSTRASPQQLNCLIPRDSVVTARRRALSRSPCLEAVTLKKLIVMRKLLRRKITCKSLQPKLKNRLRMKSLKQ